MKYKVTRIAVAVATVAGTLMLSSVAVPAFAKLSPNTGSIEGRAPTATGDIVLGLSGESDDWVDNDTLSSDRVLNDMEIRSFDFTLSDDDGDIGLALTRNPLDEVHQWLNVDTNKVVPSADFSKQIKVAGLADRLLKLTIATPLTVTSTTGVPRSNSLNSSTSAFVQTLNSPRVWLNLAGENGGKSY